MMEWLDISTAPKDRIIILGLEPTDEYPEGHACQGQWQEGWEDSVDDMGCNDGFVDSQFDFFIPPRLFGSTAYQTGGLQPTHWMPLPKAPAM